MKSTLRNDPEPGCCLPFFNARPGVGLDKVMGSILILALAVLVVHGIACAESRANEPFRERLRQRFAQSGAARRNAGQAKFSEIAGLKVAVWEPKDLTGPAPLVVFSHGFRGINTQSVPLMEALAAAGYIVIAPNHKDALTSGGLTLKPQQPLGQISKWNETTYKDRGEDIQRLIAALKKDPHWNGKIDWAEVGLVGHSLGGYTVLGLVGAWPTWKISGIKAVVALSPYSHPFNRQSTLAGITVPIMYQTGTTDFGVGPFLKGPNGTFGKTSAPAYLVEIIGANHFTWTNLNREQSKQDLINYYCISFLNRYVKGDSSAKPEARLPGITTLEVNKNPGGNANCTDTTR